MTKKKKIRAKFSVNARKVQGDILRERIQAHGTHVFYDDDDSALNMLREAFLQYTSGILPSFDYFETASLSILFAIPSVVLCTLFNSNVHYNTLPCFAKKFSLLST